LWATPPYSKTAEAIIRWSHWTIGTCWYIKIIKNVILISCSKSFSETLLRFDTSDDSIREDISVFSSREIVGRSVKSTKRISSLERDDASAFDFFEKNQESIHWTVSMS